MTTIKTPIGLACLFAMLLCSCAVRQHTSPAADHHPLSHRTGSQTGPSSARGSSSKLETDLYSGDFKKTAANIDNNKFLLRDRNRLLYLMEKGKVEYLAGHYNKSNEIFEQAYQMIDDKIKTSAGQAIAASLTNPMATPYKGEDFEKVAIHYYKALNYFEMGDPSEALIEAKRINIKLNEMNEKYKDSKNKYAADAFSQIVQGILYEATGDINNAFIAYRDAEEIYEANNNAYFGVLMPEQLKTDLLRTARQLGFTDELHAYQKKFGIPQDTATVNVRSSAVVKQNVARKHNGKATTSTPAQQVAAHAAISNNTIGSTRDNVSYGEVIIFWENGLGPIKSQTKITVGGVPGASGAMVSTGDDDMIITIPAGVNIGLTSIAIPKYVTRQSYYTKASVLFNDNERFFELSEDYNEIAKQCLKDRMSREVAEIAIRVAAKKAASKGLSTLANHFLGSAGSELTSLATNVVNVATEKADLRNWQSLPSTISYVRLPLKLGDNIFTLKKYGPNGVDEDSIHIVGKPGLQIVSYSDLGRTIN